ncbi:DUF4913 domain-containing protein [Nocardia carnea]|uniref:DUF4913 domain-containing protein n=1 Tax=Nocardia carnea TaxID=37328 RepID=UPI00245471CE|nr:DUF4913 domain-containing protein [Nocardia carnea]
MTDIAIDPVLAWLTADDLQAGRTATAELAEISEYLTETGIDLDPVLEFVTGPLARLYVRQVTDTNDVVWCPQWWYHPEAIERFAILRATRYAIDDLAGLSDWWFAYAEPHMDALMHYRGPFRGCSARKGHRNGNRYGSMHRPSLPTTLPTTPRPAALAVA